MSSSPSDLARSIVFWKGVADVAVAGLLTFSPQTIYGSVISRSISNATGLRISDAATAPGFNQAIANAVAAVGVSYVVASYSASRDALRPSWYMSATWSLLSFIVCAVAPEKASSTVLFTACNHLLFTVALWAAGSSSILGGRGAKVAKGA